jgi:peptidylprolyl isomerase
MPPSKQVRSAQNRQKDRLAVAAVEKHRIRRRRRIIASIVAVVVVAGLVILGVATHSSSKKKVNVSAPTTPNANNATSLPPTTAALTSAKGKKCVGLKDTPPKGAPTVPIFPGPPPKTLVIHDIKQGTGKVVPKGATVTVNYIGVACSTGKIFDSSWSRGQPATFPLSGVVKGWTDGIPGMKVGGERLLVIPPADGYGSAGSPGAIAPDETLYFVINMNSFTPAGTPTTT